MSVRIIHGDARDLSALKDGSIHCVATSPPYFGLRSYLAKDDPRKVLEIGAERTPEAYIGALVDVFRGVGRVLRDDGSMWLNLGDCYSGAPPGNARPDHSGNDRIGTRGAQQASSASLVARPSSRGMPSKNLLLMPYRVAIALQADGWILRAAIPWVKATCMPESVTDRPTTAHETVFLFAKSERYFADPDAVRVPGSSTSHGGKPIEGGAKQAAIGQQVGGRMGIPASLAGRNIRTSDLFDTALDVYERVLADQAAHVAHVRANGGMLLSQDGDPLALLVNPVPSTYKHFAMWPPDLVKPMIMFSTPEAGVCAACGAPRKRIVERSRYPREETSHRGESAWAAGAAMRNDVDLTRSGQEFNRWKRDNPDRLMGWEATCSCSAAAIPATVLDPFGGTGTTARVAEDLGRDSVIVELNGKSVQIAEARTAQAGLLGRAVAL